MSGLNGLEATAQISQDCREARVIVLSMHVTEQYVTQALREMAHRYLPMPPVIVGPGTKTGVPILTDNPREVAESVNSLEPAWRPRRRRTAPAAASRSADPKATRDLAVDRRRTHEQTDRGAFTSQ